MKNTILKSLYHKAGVLAFGAAAILISANISHGAVGGTKHNFGSLSPGDVKTLDSSEICVFCHTPHNSDPSAPLWNRNLSGSTYNVYDSLTIVAAVGQPTGSSKLCLSCHDGTIAVGSLLNIPGKGLAGNLPVTGTGIDQGKITATSTAYIGTDLRDDHPISFDYALSYPDNTEIKPSSSFPPEVKLDSANMVQCRSCHDPHGTNNPKFMVASLENGALCNACHDKRYWVTMPAVHSESTVTWNGTGTNPWHEDMGVAGFTDDTPQMQSCLACHRSHGGAAGKPLLGGINPGTSTIDDEEWTCLGCHNGNTAATDIEPAFDYLYKHDVKGTFGLHRPERVLPGDPVRESATNLGLTNRHVECADCHNSHGAMAGNHTIGGVNGNLVAPNLLGSWGVRPEPWGAAGTPAVTYLEVDFLAVLPGGDNLEGYLCLKCHSYYAYGPSPPFVPSGNADGSPVRQSDATTDFNPFNMGYHPVFAQGKNIPLETANPNWPLNTLGLTNTFRYVDFPGVGLRTGFYNVRHNSTITCSDCHGSENPSDPRGVHGSNNKWILRENETGVGSIKNFCYNCHRRDVYGDEGYIGPEANFSRVSHPVDGLGLASPFYTAGPNTGNVGNNFGILCLTCHGGAYDAINDAMQGIHGSNAAAGMLLGSDPLGYRMMNGACVESYTRPTTFTPLELQFRTITLGSDKVCNNNFTNFTGVTANYDCITVADCSN
jgi:predicted CXXCH cytochrome family protein